MGASGLAAVGIGAACGAWLRWWLGLRLNPVFPTMPLGTLAANLIGGFLVGVAVAFFNRHPSLAPEARLLVITGFMGGLTTFSTFSSEVVGLLERGDYLWGGVTACVHLFGSLALTAIGIAVVAVFSRVA
jgi:fluoride exporter